MVKFGNFLKSIRQAKMTQRELAKKIGVGFPYISKIENNIEPPPSDNLLYKMAIELDVNVDDMFIKAGRVPTDLKEFLLSNPDIIRLLRIIQEKDPSQFLHNNLDKIVNEIYMWNSFHKSKDIMLLIDPETSDIIDANIAAEKFYQYPLTKLQKMKITDINILQREKIIKEIYNAKLKLVNNFVFHHKLGNSEIKKVMVNSNPIESNGKILLQSIIEDISSNSDISLH